MSQFHKFEGSKARIKKEGGGFVSECECGWVSDPVSSREESIVKFEHHVQSDPKHEIRKKEGGKSFSSIFLGLLFLVYAVSPGIIPYSLVVVGWLDNIFALVFGLLFLKSGWDGKSPLRALSDVF